jgi:hypothetical protein
LLARLTSSAVARIAILVSEYRAYHPQVAWSEQERFEELSRFFFGFVSP